MKWREHFDDINNIPLEFADKEIEISDCLKIIDMLSFTIMELMNKSWHTGTPTEEGDYLVKLDVEHHDYPYYVLKWYKGGTGIVLSA